jgi:hypothetical protein
MAALSRFCEFWIKNTIRKVTIVVPVLITSCHVSEKPKSGPLTAHTMTTPAATIKVDARPAASDVLLARSPKNLDTLEGSLACFLPLMFAPIAGG